MNKRTSCALCLALASAALTLHAADAAVPVDQRAEFQHHYARAQALAAEGNITDARVHAERALEIGEETFGTNSENVAKLTLNYGRLLLESEQPVEATRVLKKALRRYERVYGDNAFELIDPLMHLAHASVTPGRRQILKNYRRAIMIAERHGDPELVADLNYDTGTRVLGYGKSMEGLRFLDRSVDLYGKELGPNHYKTALAHFWLAGFYFGNRDYDRAVAHSVLATGGFDDAPELRVTATDLMNQACRRLVRDPDAEIPSACSQ